MRTKDQVMHIRTAAEVLYRWKLEATIQGYGSLADFVRDAIEEKCSTSPAFLDAKLALVKEQLAKVKAARLAGGKSDGQ